MDHILHIFGDLPIAMHCYRQVTVERDTDYPLKPLDYRALEPIWEHFGFVKSKNLNISLSWKQIDTHKEESNQLASWIKTIKLT